MMPLPLQGLGGHGGGEYEIMADMTGDGDAASQN